MASCSSCSLSCSSSDFEADFEAAIAFSLEKLKLSHVSLKDEQLAAIRAVYDGHDVFVCLPTGFGKSLCFHTLPFVMEHKYSRAGQPPRRGCAVIVVSPLIALMEDQVSGLKKREVQASIITTSAAVTQDSITTDRGLVTDNLFFCAPEALVTQKWRDVLGRSQFADRVVAVVVDEAHCVSKWNKGFRPAYSRLAELRAFVPPGTPMMALTATATRSIREEVVSVLEISQHVTISIPPNRPNVKYEVKRRSDIETDLQHLLESLREQSISAPRVVVYCKTLMMCADLFSHFSFELGAQQYYPPGAPHLSDNRLFGMFHSSTPQHSKEVITKSLLDPSGVVRVVFATVAMGMGVDLKGVNTIIHYGAPGSIEDYFQASGRGGRSGEAACSLIYWSPSDCPLWKNPLTTHQKEVNDVRKYLDNVSVCRRKWLLEYFDPASAKPGDDPLMCCDNCEAMASKLRL